MSYSWTFLFLVGTAVCTALAWWLLTPRGRAASAASPGAALVPATALWLWAFGITGIRLPPGHEFGSPQLPPLFSLGGGPMIHTLTQVGALLAGLLMVAFAVLVAVADPDIAVGWVVHVPYRVLPYGDR